MRNKAVRKNPTYKGPIRTPPKESGPKDIIYSKEEEIFIKAVIAYRTKMCISFLTACDYLAIIKSLGYTLPEPTPNLLFPSSIYL